LGINALLSVGDAQYVNRIVTDLITPGSELKATTRIPLT
jgi:hypothetical protein